MVVKVPLVFTATCSRHAENLSIKVVYITAVYILVARYHFRKNMYINSVATEKSALNFRHVIFRQILVIYG